MAYKIKQKSNEEKREKELAEWEQAYKYALSQSGSNREATIFANQYILKKKIKELKKSREKLIKAKALRIWIERHPEVNVWNYPIMKLIGHGDIKRIEENLEKNT